MAWSGRSSFRRSLSCNPGSASSSLSRRLGGRSRSSRTSRSVGQIRGGPASPSRRVGVGCGSGGSGPRTGSPGSGCRRASSDGLLLFLLLVRLLVGLLRSLRLPVCDTLDRFGSDHGLDCTASTPNQSCSGTAIPLSASLRSGIDSRALTSIHSPIR